LNDIGVIRGIGEDPEFRGKQRRDEFVVEKRRGRSRRRKAGYLLGAESWAGLGAIGRGLSLERLLRFLYWLTQQNPCSASTNRGEETRLLSAIPDAFPNSVKTYHNSVAEDEGAGWASSGSCHWNQSVHAI
jgi:hypothetical protein